MKKRLLICAAGFLVASLAFADGDDPPGRAARLSYLTGTVTFQPGSVEDWVPATLNRPMTTGDRLWTEANSRAEMTIGSATVRMNGRTNFTFLNLDDRSAQVQVSVGSLSVRVRRLNDDETFEIDTPQLALTLLRPGEYRVDVNEEGDATIVGVRGGSAEATATSQAYTIKPLEQLRASGTDQVVFDERPIPPADAFDNFCEGRDRREDTSQSAKYVSRDIPGYSDLDNAGVWRQDPDYGAVWVPSGVPGDWAPYHYGHWAWIAPWGWTWVDDAPWGYAPFHYGRWVSVGGSWGWIPGPVVARPVYAPAMVAWVGGGGFGVGIAVGPAVGWFPLGPREVFVPGYVHSAAYVERVNVTNTVIVNRTVFNNVNVTNVNYMNRNVAGAVTVMPQSQMTAGRPVAAAAIRMPPAELARVQVQASAAVVPERGAVVGGRATVSAAPPAAVMNRPVVAKMAPPPAPVAFAQQQQALRQNPGQPVPPSRLAQIQTPQGNGGSVTRPVVRQVGPQAPNRPGQVPAAAQTPGQPATPQPGRPGFNREPQGGTPGAPGQAPNGQPQFNRGPQNNNTPAAAQTPGRPNPAEPGQGRAGFNREPQNNNTPAATPTPSRPNPAEPGQGRAGFNREPQNNNTPAAAPTPGRPNPAEPGQGRPGFNREPQNPAIPAQTTPTQPRPVPPEARPATPAAPPAQVRPQAQPEARPAAPPAPPAQVRPQAQPEPRPAPPNRQEPKGKQTKKRADEEKK